MARPAARPVAVTRAASPALRPGLTGTRRRNAGGDLWPGGRHILEALRRRGGPDDEIVPAARAGLQQSGTQSCAIAARAHRAQLLADRATSARAMVDTLRGHVRRGACGPAFCLCGSSEAWRSVAPHLPTADAGSPAVVRDFPQFERRFWFLQASAPARVSTGRAWPRGREVLAWPVEDRTGHGGAHGRAEVRVRPNLTGAAGRAAAALSAAGLTRASLNDRGFP